MVDTDAIWARARNDMVIQTDRGGQDFFLWEHAARVAKNADVIARLPSVQLHEPDASAILAASLYHDAGWVVRFEEGSIGRGEVLLYQPPDNHRERSADRMEAALIQFLPAEGLSRASRAIRTLHDRHETTIEGQVVAEARNLDEFGLTSLWPSIRRGSMEGKGVQAVLETWRRRKEYRFWTARLKDSFRFPEVRELARERLVRFEQAMTTLEMHHEGIDLDRLAADIAGMNAGTHDAVR